MRTLKSRTMRSRIGSPRSLTTVTSIGSASTPERKLGAVRGVSCARPAPAARTAIAATAGMRVRILFRGDRAVALPRAHATLAVNLHGNLPERVVALGIGRLVPKQ